jgi:hypothetical protein
MRLQPALPHSKSIIELSCKIDSPSSRLSWINLLGHSADACLDAKPYNGIALEILVLITYESRSPFGCRQKVRWAAFDAHLWQRLQAIGTIGDGNVDDVQCIDRQKKYPSSYLLGYSVGCMIASLVVP